jgi:hypothetical protein
MNVRVGVGRIAEWTALTTIGLAGGLVAGLLVGMPLSQIANAMIVTGAVTGVVGGVLGSFQAIGLRRILDRPFWWIAATTAGLGSGLAAGVVLVEQVGIFITGNRPHLAQLSTSMRALSFVAVGLVAGTLLGVLQTFVIRRQIPSIRNWILVTAVALAIAFSASSLAVDLSGIRFASAAGAITFLLLSSMTFGIMTSWPLRHAR